MPNSLLPLLLLAFDSFLLVLEPSGALTPVVLISSELFLLV